MKDLEIGLQGFLEIHIEATLVDLLESGQSTEGLDHERKFRRPATIDRRLSYARSLSHTLDGQRRESDLYEQFEGRVEDRLVRFLGSRSPRASRHSASARLVSTSLRHEIHLSHQYPLTKSPSGVDCKAITIQYVPFYFIQIEADEDSQQDGRIQPLFRRSRQKRPLPDLQTASRRSACLLSRGVRHLGALPLRG